MIVRYAISASEIRCEKWALYHHSLARYSETKIIIGGLQFVNQTFMQNPNPKPNLNTQTFLLGFSV